MILPHRELEVYLPMRIGEQTTPFKTRIELKEEEGFIDLKIIRVDIGSFHAPSFLVDIAARPILTEMIPYFNQVFGKYLTVDSLNTEQGKMFLSGGFRVESK